MKKPKTGIEALRLLPSWIVDLVLDWMERTRATISQDVRKQLSSDFKRASPSIFYTARTTRDLTSLLPDVNIPTLILWGRDDLTLEPTSFQTMVEVMPSAQAHVFSQTGHIPHLSRTTSFNQQVLNFLNNLR
jgi:pimeloyl-ACP methyl ester carboxylesterase